MKSSKSVEIWEFAWKLLSNNSNLHDQVQVALYYSRHAPDPNERLKILRMACSYANEICSEPFEMNVTIEIQICQQLASLGRTAEALKSLDRLDSKLAKTS